MRKVIFVAAFAVAAAGLAQVPAPTVIKDATILTVTRGVIERGSILIRDGRIAEVGEKVNAPRGARVIDAAGKYIMPGIIDTHSHIGVYSWPEVEANSDGNEMTDPVTAQVRAADAVNIQDPAIPRALAGGVTTIQILPGSGNMIGGESVVIKLKQGKRLDEMLFPGAPRGIKMASGENPKRIYGRRNQMPSTRMGNFFVLRNAFVQAQNYMRRWEDYEQKRAAGQDAEYPGRDLKMETLADVLRGRVRVHIHCYRQDEILTLFRIADEFGFKIASLQHCLEGYKVAEQIAKRNIGVATFSDWWGYKIEAWDGIPHNAAIMASKGVRVAIHSDSADLIQRLYHEAAKAVKYGLPEEEGLRAITINPAWMLGIDNRVGSIEVGKDADLAIFNRHPFDILARVDLTMIDGEVVYERK